MVKSTNDAVGVVALFGAVVDPHRRHAQRLGGGEVARHVLDEARVSGGSMPNAAIIDA